MMCAYYVLKIDFGHKYFFFHAVPQSNRSATTPICRQNYIIGFIFFSIIFYNFLSNLVLSQTVKYHALVWRCVATPCDSIKHGVKKNTNFLLLNMKYLLPFIHITKE